MFSLFLICLFKIYIYFSLCFAYAIFKHTYICERCPRVGITNLLKFNISLKILITKKKNYEKYIFRFLLWFFFGIRIG